MGNVPNITTRLFPKQGDWLGRRTKVCFHFDASDIVMGTVVRDDMESPWVTIIRLDDGRVVLGTECQHSPLAPAACGDALAPPVQSSAPTDGAVTTPAPDAHPTCDSCVHLTAFELSDDLFTCPVVNIRIHRESAAIFGCNQHEGK